MVAKRLQKVAKGCKKPIKVKGGLSKLTPTESEVLHLITEEFLTPKKVAIRRGCSIGNINNIIVKLKKKGYLKGGCKKVANFEGTLQPSGCRLHGEVYKIVILDKGQNHEKNIGLKLDLDNNKIHVHKDSILIYSNKSFFGEDAVSATQKACKYWDRIIARLENDLHLILSKPRSQNIHRVKQEYANIRNGLAKSCNKTGEKIKIRNKGDGKVWFMIDNSFNLHEAETPHPKDAETDMQDIAEPFFNDLKYNRPPLSSDMYKLVAHNTISINKCLELQYSMAMQMSQLITLLKSLLPTGEAKGESGGDSESEGVGYIG